MHVCKALTFRIACLLAGAGVSFSFFWPTTSNNVDFRSLPVSMSIQVGAISPPLAAFEDSITDYSQRASPAPVHFTEVHLVNSQAPLNLALFKLPTHPRAHAERHPAEWASLILPVARVEAQIQQQQAPAQATANRQHRSLALKPIVLSHSDVNVIAWLPDRERSVLYAEAKAPTHPQVVRPAISFTHFIPAASKPTPFVDFHPPMRPTAEPLPSQLPKAHVIVEQPKSAGDPKAESVASFKPATINPDSDSTRDPNLTATGTLELDGGLALTNNREAVIIQHFLNGVPVESGTIDISSGTFRIQFHRPLHDSLGSLVAKLISARGQVFGRGEIDLGRVPLSTMQIHHLAMHIRPIPQGIFGRVISAYSFGGAPIPVKNAKIQLASTDIQLTSGRDGKFHDKAINSGSDFILRTHQRGYWNSLTFARTGNPASIPLFPNSMIKALIDLSGLPDRSQAKNLGVVWGRITRHGEPMAGASVQIADSEALPIYFRSISDFFLPDPQQTATGPNGYFAFVGLQPGIKMIRVLVHSQALYAQTVQVDRHYVTSLNFETDSTRVSDLTVTDALYRTTRLDANARWSGSSGYYHFLANGKDPLLAHWRGTGLRTLDIDAGQNYALTRISVEGFHPQIHAPLASYQWLQWVAGQARINSDPRLGTVILNTSGSEFDAFLENHTGYELTNRVYVTEQGVPTFADHGSDNGMVIFFNVPIGLQTVFLTSPRNERFTSQIVSVQPGIVSMASHKF